MEKVNINNTVWVKLTDIGRDIYFHQYDELNRLARRIIMEPKYPTEIDGYFEEQLWCLFEIFGPHINMGTEMPFEMEIYLTDPHKKEK